MIRQKLPNSDNIGQVCSVKGQPIAKIFGRRASIDIESSCVDVQIRICTKSEKQIVCLLINKNKPVFLLMQKIIDEKLGIGIHGWTA
jgi:hypothetical protein